MPQQSHQKVLLSTSPGSSSPTEPRSQVIERPVSDLLRTPLENLGKLPPTFFGFDAFDQAE